MKYLHILLVFALSYTLSSCQYEAYSKEISFQRVLYARDSMADMELCYEDEDQNLYPLVPKTVFALGMNKNYIIAKQHPDGKRTETHYYVIPLNSKTYEEKKHNFSGPLTLQEFIEKKKEYNIQDLEFSMVYHELE